MRYTGGLLGGSWLTALTSDLGNGKFDGTWLVLNFDNLEPGELAVGQAVRGLCRRRHRRAALPRIRELVGRLHPAQRRRVAVPGGQSVRRRQADPQPAEVERRHDLRSPQRHLADHRVHLDGRQHQPAAADAGLDPRSLPRCRRDPRDRPDHRLLPEPEGRPPRHLRVVQGRREGGRGIRAADGRDRLPAARPLSKWSSRRGRPTCHRAASSPATGSARFETRSLDDIRALGRNSDDGRPRVCGLGPAVGTEPLDLPHHHAAAGARARQPAGGRPGSQR